MKIGILASHPIQYQAPLFRELARRVDLVVYFAHRQTAAGQAEAGFNVAFEWDVDLLAGYTSHFLENRARTPSPSHFFGCNTPGIAACLDKENFDAFIVTGWNLWCYWQAVLACRDRGITVLVRGDSHLGTQRHWLKRQLKALLYPMLLRNFSGCLYVGQKNREYLEHYGVVPEKLFFSPHCVDNEWFADKAAGINRADLRLQWQIGDQQKVVLFVGRLVPMKRPQDFLTALAGLRDCGVDAVGVIVGDGPLLADLKQQAGVLGINIRFAGFRNQSELPGFYAMADVMVLPSEPAETWGLVVNEAMACGTPAVVADSVGCSADLIKEGTGAVYEKGDCEALAAALVAVLSEPRDEAPIQRLLQHYSVQAAAEGILDACRHLAGRCKVTNWLP